MPKRPMQWEGSGDVRMFSQLRSMSETWSPPPQYTVTILHMSSGQEEQQWERRKEQEKQNKLKKQEEQEKQEQDKQDEQGDQEDQEE